MLFFKYQFGFRPDKGTDQAIANVTKTIYTALEKGKKCATIYLDLTKAFDTVDHNIFLNKMNSIGITGSSLSLFTSYLNNRKQMVKINDSINNELSIECGAPQGTTLSPILCNIQLNDIKTINLKSKVICYADDTALICIANTWNEVFNNIKTDLKTIDSWLGDNNLF